MALFGDITHADTARFAHMRTTDGQSLLNSLMMSARSGPRQSAPARQFGGRRSKALTHHGSLRG
jgi:hypothetical protein